VNCNYDLSKKPYYRAFNAICGKAGSLASIEVVVELLTTKCILILLYGLDACPVSSRQLRSLNYVVVSCARKVLNSNSSEIAAECIKMFGISDIAETVAMRRDRFIKRFVSNRSAVCEICCAMSGHL